MQQTYTSFTNNSNENNEFPPRRGPDAEPELFDARQAKSGSTRIGNQNNKLVPKVVATSCILGLVIGTGATLAACGPWTAWQIPLFVSCLALFHFLEYFVTAKYNPDQVSYDSFLFNNGWQYNAAQALALCEAAIEARIWPETLRSTSISVIGFSIAAGGQILRTMAMIHAASNFNHIVQQKKSDTHVLVSSGVYSISRHPSYAGFFYWAVGLQVALCNPISFVVFIITLWTFFNSRIRIEEKHLVEFFGEKYLAYRKRTPVLIPFV